MVFTGAGGMRAERSGWHSREMSSSDPHTARGGPRGPLARGISMAYLLLVSWPLKHADTVSNGFYTFLHSQKLPLKMPPCTAQPSSHPACSLPAAPVPPPPAARHHPLVVKHKFRSQPLIYLLRLCCFPCPTCVPRALGGAGATGRAAI